MESDLLLKPTLAGLISILAMAAIVVILIGGLLLDRGKHNRAQKRRSRGRAGRR